MDLQTVKEYFGAQMKTFAPLPELESRLSQAEKTILHETGLPEYGGYAGYYILLPELIIENDRYLKFGTRKNNEDEFFMYLDLNTKEVVFKFYSDGYNLMNSTLEAYLNYVYIYHKNFDEVIDPEKFGPYELNHQQYADELEKSFLQYNEDVRITSWSELIEEMGYGII